MQNFTAEAKTRHEAIQALAERLVKMAQAIEEDLVIHRTENTAEENSDFNEGPYSPNCVAQLVSGIILDIVFTITKVSKACGVEKDLLMMSLEEAFAKAATKTLLQRLKH